MTDTATTLLDEVQSCHDDDPTRAAGLLRRIAPSDLAPERWPGYAFLLNHVLGEKLGAWPEAHAMFDPLLQVAGTQAPQALWRQAAAAALLAGGKVAHVHVKNFVDDPDGERRPYRYCPPRDGKVDYAYVVEQLAAVGYDGFVSFEPEGFPHAQAEDGIRYLAELLSSG